LIILGIDPGLRFTGLGIINYDSKKRKFIETDWRIIDSKGDNLAERIKSIYREIEEILEQTKPDISTIETLFFGKNTKTLIHLGELRGAIILLLSMKEIPIIEYSPREIKMALTGSGSSSKQQVGQMVKCILGINGEIPPDATDALASAICYLQREYG